MPNGDEESMDPNQHVDDSNSIGSLEPQPPNHLRARNINATNPFDRVIIIDDLDNRDDQARFLIGMNVLSQ